MPLRRAADPLLRDDLEEICSFLDHRSCVNVGTTGWGLTPRRARALRQSGVFGVGISLDSDNAANHDRMRGKGGAFRAAVDAIAVARDAGLYAYVVSVATREFLQTDRHVLLLCRYVERNALRAGLVERAEQWRWGSLWRRVSGADEQREVLAPWPVDRPRNWVQLVNRPMRESEQEAIGQSVKRGRPYGDVAWQSKTTALLGLEDTFRNRGRPRKEKE